MAYVKLAGSRYITDEACLYDLYIKQFEVIVSNPYWGCKCSRKWKNGLLIAEIEFNILVGGG